MARRHRRALGTSLKQRQAGCATLPTRAKLAAAAHPLASLPAMFGVGFPELVVILVVALLVFGPARLPGARPLPGTRARRVPARVDRSAPEPCSKPPRKPRQPPVPAKNKAKKIDGEPFRPPSFGRTRGAGEPRPRAPRDASGWMKDQHAPADRPTFAELRNTSLFRILIAWSGRGRNGVLVADARRFSAGRSRPAVKALGPEGEQAPGDRSDRDLRHLSQVLAARGFRPHPAGDTVADLGLRGAGPVPGARSVSPFPSWATSTLALRRRRPASATSPRSR